jgi:hypothetical protein
VLAGINHTTNTKIITWFEASDIWPDIHHGANYLMARHRWVSAATTFIVDMVQVHMIYVTVENLDNYIVSACRDAQSDMGLRRPWQKMRRNRAHSWSIVYLSLLDLYALCYLWTRYYFRCKYQHHNILFHMKYSFRLYL